MCKTISFRLLMCCALALSATLVGAHAAHAWGGGGGGSSSCNNTPDGGSTSASDSSVYQTIIDFTQAATVNVLVTNIAASMSTRDQPHIGASPAPYAGVDPSLIPNTFTNWPSGSSSDMYVRVAIDTCDLTDTGLRAATNYTCNQSDPTQCPSSTPVEPTTFVHRLGWYDSSNGVVKALTNSAIGSESLNTLFSSLSGQAFDMDRLRYAANHLWDQWRKESKGTDTTGNWTSFGYQPTGTMSFENFVHNVVKGYPMYGIVRVVVPVDSNGKVYYNPKMGVAGAEFASGAYTYNKSDDVSYSGSKGLYTFEEMDTADGRSGSSSNAKTSKSGTIKVYGMLLFDFVNVDTYDPIHFFDKEQDYVDRYADVATHDADTSTTNRLNVIESATVSRNNIALWDWDTLDVNAVDDLKTFVKYTDTKTAGEDGRPDTLDIIRRKYMMQGSTNSKSFDASEISDAYIWEYWMRKAATASSTVQSSILSDLASQYDIATQTFTNTTGRKADFINTEWSTLSEKNKFHAYFPNGYERGWMIAFQKLDLAALDQTTASKAVGSWWSQLPEDATSSDGIVDGSTLGADQNHSGHSPSGPYTDFTVPTDTLTVDADGSGTAVTMPNFFTTGWEDLPALAFAGGLLDVHGFMNVSGMMYTPDSCELETHPASGQPSSPAQTGAFEYVNGAILIGDGFWLQDDGGSGNDDDSLIAVSYNYNSFDQLRNGSANLNITKATNISEIKG